MSNLIHAAHGAPPPAHPAVSAAHPGAPPVHLADVGPLLAFKIAHTFTVSLRTESGLPADWQAAWPA